MSIMKYPTSASPACTHATTPLTGKAFRIWLRPFRHSFNAETREWNTASLEGYIKSIEEGQRSSETEILDKVTRYNEYIMTSLRTMWGASLTYTEEAFGTELCQYCMKIAVHTSKATNWRCRQTACA